MSPIAAPRKEGAGVQGQTSAQATGSLAGFVITIDPGHASNPDPGTEPVGPGSSVMKVKDPGGTSGVSTGTPEYVVAMDISLQL